MLGSHSGAIQNISQNCPSERLRGKKSVYPAASILINQELTRGNKSHKTEGILYVCFELKVVS